MIALREFGPDIWIADGPAVRFIGVLFPTRMIVVKLGDGSLWINSPVSASQAEIERVAAIGPVQYLVAPTRLHIWRLQQWAGFFPTAQLWAPPGTAPRYRDLSFAGVLGDEPPAAWASDLDQMVFRGAPLEEVHFLHAKSGTLIVADFIQNYPPQQGRILLNTLRRLGGVLNGGVPVDIRLSFIANRALGQKSLQKLLSWDFDKLIVAHGTCIEAGAKPFVKQTFRWLSR